MHSRIKRTCAQLRYIYIDQSVYELWHTKGSDCRKTETQLFRVQRTLEKPVNREWTNVTIHELLRVFTSIVITWLNLGRACWKYYSMCRTKWHQHFLRKRNFSGRSWPNPTPRRVRQRRIVICFVDVEAITRVCASRLFGVRDLTCWHWNILRISYSLSLSIKMPPFA